MHFVLEPTNEQTNDYPTFWIVLFSTTIYFCVEREDKAEIGRNERHTPSLQTPQHFQCVPIER